MDTPNSEGGGPLYSIPRRSQRVEVSIAVTLIGKDASGREFRENTRTVIVNKHGAKLTTAHRLALGNEIEVENRKLGRKGKAKVVWLGENPSPKDPLKIGIQLCDAADIWGIDFPAEDRQESAPKTFMKAEGPLAETPSVREPMPAGSPGASGARLAGGRTDELSSLLRDSMGALMQDFEKKLAAMADEAGIRAGANLEAAATEFQKNIRNSADEQLKASIERLDAARADLGVLLKDAESARESAQRELDRTQADIRAATTRAVDAAIEELSARISKDLDSRQGGLTASITEQITRASIERVTKAVEERVGNLLPDFEAQISAKVLDRLNAESEQTVARARQQLGDSAKQAAEESAASLDKAARARLQGSLADAGQQAKQLSASALDQLRREIGALVQETDGKTRAQLKKMTATSLEEHLTEARRRIVQAAEEILATKQIGVKESIVEDVRARLTRLSKGTAEAMNKEAMAGLERYQAELRKKAEDEFKGAAERLKKETQDAISEATEVFRSSLAGAFSSLSPTGKKSPKEEQS